MTPQEVISKCKRDGLSLFLKGTQIEVRGPRDRLTESLANRLRIHKPALIYLLTRDPVWREVATWGEDAFEEWDERAGILEYMDNLPRDRAERVAFEQISPKVREARVQRKAG